MKRMPLLGGAVRFYELLTYRTACQASGLSGTCLALIYSAYFASDFANCCHVSMIESGFSEIDAIPSSVSHCAKSG